MRFFSPTGWVARFDATGAGPDELLVEAWDSNGNALVVDTEAGCLVKASSRPGFRSLRPTSRIVTAVSAAPGWQLARWVDDKDDASEFREPIAAWLVDTEGCVYPVGGADDTWLEPILARRTGILPPQAPEPAQAPEQE